MRAFKLVPATFALGLGLLTQTVATHSTALAEEARTETKAKVEISTTTPSGRIRAETTLIIEDEPARVRKMAVFVKNKSTDKEVDGRVDSLAERVGSGLSEYISDKGLKLAVMSREDTVNAVSSFSTRGANAGDPSGAGAGMDKALSNNTSMLRLAQAMDADFILTVSINAATREEKTYEGNGVKTVNTESRMDLSFQLLDAAEGAAGDGGKVTATKMSRGGGKSDAVSEAVLADAAEKITAKIGPRLEKTLREPAKPRKAILTVNPAVQGFTIPDVLVDKDGNLAVGSKQIAFEPVNVSVEVNGFVIGSAPGELQAVSRGPQKIRLKRAGMKDFEANVLVNGNMTLNVDMQLDEQGYQRWKETANLLQSLKTGERLSAATADALRGFAQMLRQSGYKVDAKSDVKVDTDLKGVTYQSIFK